MQSSILFLFFCQLTILLYQVVVRRADSEELLRLSMSNLSGRKYSLWSFLFLLMSLPDHFYFEEYELCPYPQSLHVFFLEISISDANGGQSIRFVIMSNRSKQSVSKHVEVILLSFIHEATQSKPSISACKDERLLLHAPNPRNLVPTWSFRLHPRPLILPLLIHEALIWP